MISTIVIFLKVSLILAIAGYAFACFMPSEIRKWLIRRVIWIPPFLFIAGMIAPTLIFILVGLIIFLPIYARSREEAAALFPVIIFSIPFMQMEVRAGGASLFNLSTWAAAGIGFFLSTIVKQRTAQQQKNSASIIVAFGLCFFVLTVPAIHGANFTSTIRALLNSCIFLVFPFVAFSRSLSRLTSLRAVIAIALICFCQAILGIFASKTNWPIYDVMPVRLDAGNWGVKIRGGLLRVGGVMLDSTYFSILLAMGLTAVLALEKTFKSKGAFYLAFAFTALGLVATTARGGVFAAGVAFVVMPLATRKRGVAGFRALIAVSAYGLLLLAAQMSSIAANLTGGTADTAGTADYRKRLLQRGIEEIQHHPLTGIDTATMNIVMSDLRQGEHIIDFVNGYIMAGVFGGVGMVIALIAAFIIPIYLLVTRSPLPEKNQQEVAKFCIGVHFSTVLSCFTTGFTGAVVLPYFIALALTGAILSGKRGFILADAK